MAIAATLNANAVTKIDYSPAEYLRNYALSVCIAEGYSAKEVKNDAAAAARGYMEFGDYSSGSAYRRQGAGKRISGKAL